MKKVILILTMIFLLTLFLGADVYMKNMERIKAFELMGSKQKEQIEIKERWFSENKYAQTGKDYDLIIDLDKEKVVVIIHSIKTYYEFPTDISGEKLQKLLLFLSPKVLEIIKSVRITDVKVNHNQETKRIANWNCRSSELDMVIMIPALNMMPKYRMKIWATKDLPPKFKNYTKMGEEFFIKYVLGLISIDEDSKEQLNRFNAAEGFQVASEISVSILGSEINIESQCLEIEEKPSPPGTYEVPRGYTKKNLDIF